MIKVDGEGLCLHRYAELRYRVVLALVVRNVDWGLAVVLADISTEYAQ